MSFDFESMRARQPNAPAVVLLSGGLDSAVVSILCKEAFRENLNCVLMPSQFSSKSSIEKVIFLKTFGYN